MPTPDSLRILHITPYYDPAWAYGGPVRVVYELTKRLAARGHEVRVLTTDAQDSHHRAPAGEHLIDGVSVRRFCNVSNTLAWSRIFMPLGFGRDLANTMRAYDVIHLHDFRTVQNIFALSALKRTHGPCVISPHGGLPLLGRASYKHLYDALFGRRLLRNAARLHALNEMEADQYRAFDVPQARLALIPNGIDTHAFDMEVDVAAFKHQWHIPADRPVVGFLARLSPIKGPDFLIDAFARVLQSIPESILVLAGPDDGAQPALEAQIDQLGIRESVRLVGYLENSVTKAAAYHAFNVYVLPSRYEIQGITVMEALLNETPSITTERCGLAACLKSEDAAAIVPFGDIEALAAQITQMLRNRDHAVTQAKRGHRLMMDRFSWDAVTDQWVDTYRACIA